MKLSRRITLACLTLLMPALLSAQATSYVLEAGPSANIYRLAAFYHFTVDKAASGGDEILYSITAAAPFSRAAIQQLSSEPGIREVSTNGHLETAERNVSRPAVALQSLGAWFFTKAAVNYYGNPVLSSYVNQPAASIIHLPQALQSFGLGSGIVAIIDTGVDTRHPALRGALVPGWDFTRDRADTVSEWVDLTPAQAAKLGQSTVEILDQSTVEILDSKKFAVVLDQSTVEILDQSTVEILDGANLPKAFGHGTMVAGLVHLVAPNARIMPLKAFKSDGSATLYDVTRAIRWAADHGAQVINMSLSYTDSSPALLSAIQYAQAKGAICVASSGNLGKEMKVYPASYSYVMGVGSVNFTDRRSPFSNWGGSARTSAPGEALVTTYPGGHYAAVWGTSFSTALVSGAAALMRPLRWNLGTGYFRDAVDHGQKVEQGMGDARLDLVSILTYCLRH